MRCVRTTRSSTHSHPFQVTLPNPRTLAHKSSFIQSSHHLNRGTHCHPLLSLNPTICHPINLMSTNLILSPFLLNLPIFSVLPLSGLCYRPYGLSLTLCTKKKKSCEGRSHVQRIAVQMPSFLCLSKSHRASVWA